MNIEGPALALLADNLDLSACPAHRRPPLSNLRHDHDSSIQNHPKNEDRGYQYQFGNPASMRDPRSQASRHPVRRKPHALLIPADGGGNKGENL
jgi:hypothetical protein